MNHKIPEGFKFSVSQAAIKKPGRPDIALIYSEADCTMAGMFTRNKIKSASVKLSMKRIKSMRGRILFMNSGNANACTGENGMRDAMEITKIISERTGVDEDLIYISSTGVIGTPLPMDRIRNALPLLIESAGKATLDDVACAIMTTDTFPKISSREVIIDGRISRIAGIAKGAGMINPMMATMLCFIITDIDIDGYALKKALSFSVNNTFNKITVDGDMSTNDTVMVMANGLCKNKRIKEGSKKFRLFRDLLFEVCDELSRMIIKDGEGATKVIEIQVKNARNKDDAVKVARAISNSLLFKTAMYGNDSNWGRIMAATGSTEAVIKEEKIDIYFGDILLVRNGTGTGMDEKVNEYLRKNREIKIIIDLNCGRSSYSVLTNDLSEEYVRINALYRT